MSGTRGLMSQQQGWRWPRAAAVTALGALSLSLASMLCLHLLAVSEMSPLADTVSRYAHMAGGGWLFALGALALSLAFLASAAGMATVGVRFDGVTRTLAVAWGLSLVFVACFPSDPPGTRHTLAGLAHNWASASVFLCLPAAGWRISHTLTGHAAWRGLVRVVRWLAAGAGLALVAFLLTHPPLHQWYGGVALHGVPERVLLGLEAALVLVLSTRLLQVARAPASQADPARSATQRPETAVAR